MSTIWRQNAKNLLFGAQNLYKIRILSWAKHCQYFPLCTAKNQCSPNYLYHCELENLLFMQEKNPKTGYSIWNLTCLACLRWKLMIHIFVVYIALQICTSYYIVPFIQKLISSKMDGMCFTGCPENQRGILFINFGGEISNFSFCKIWRWCWTYSCWTHTWVRGAEEHTLHLNYGQ